jgi:GNAT superfamily N-acetyltransferase
VRADTDRELNPDDPPPPVEELATEVFVRSEVVARRAWVAMLDGEPAGELTFALEPSPENQHLIDVEWLAVRPHLRRRGVADALLRTGLAWAAADGRTSVVLWVPTLADGAGAAYAARCGLAVAQVERCSRLRVADTDRALLDAWIAEGRGRTDGYRLVQFSGPTPDEHVDAVVAAHRAMEDMPVDDLEWTIPSMTPAKLRSREAAWAESGRLNVTSLVLAPDGSAAGLSELQVNQHRPELAAQGDTGVRAEHRGHGLGRWLKAENLRLALATEPRIRVVETYNAETNPWMLDINVAMGFRPHVGYEAFQGQVADALGVVEGVAVS